MVNETNNSPSIRVRVLSRNLNLTNTKQQGLQWLIGSPFFPQFTIISTIRCIQTQTPIDFAKEASDLRPLILRGFDVIGALLIGERQNARSAIDAARRMREALLSGGGDHRGICGIVGAVGDVVTGKIEFFVAKAKNFEEIESVRDVVYEDFPEKWMWERGCLVKCELGLKVPIYVPVNKPNDSEAIFSAAVDAAVSKFRDPKIVYMIEGAQEASGAVPQPVIVRGVELDFNMELSDVAVLKENSDERNAKNLCCSYFCSRSKPVLSLSTKESADVVQVSILLNQSGISSKSSAPIAEYFPAPETVKLIVVSFKMEVLCYVAKDLSVAYAITKLIVPGIADQLKAMKKVIMPNLLGQHPQKRSDSEGEKTHLYNSFVGLNMEVKNIDKFADSREVEGYVDSQGRWRMSPNPNNETALGDGFKALSEEREGSNIPPVTDGQRREATVVTEVRVGEERSRELNQGVEGRDAGMPMSRYGTGMSMFRQGQAPRAWETTPMA
ncbi:hypothetical protein GIB67_027789 [Kingdonia uniflora]|uniref:Uncharacterized protein n=1 Tax=Kingdonia uniflora TaxID=39325 RepID=A0A7J7PC42_9MAGN|nr:hypothetical protein GIB67_027789 [Kingdonia uniflora]